MKIIATTKIDCPNSPKRRHAVTLHDDGSVVCECGDGRERGAALAGRMLLGLPPVDGARGCGALAALVDGADTLLPLVRGTWQPDYGAWAELMFAYGKNPVFRAAIDRAECTHEPARPEIRRLVMEYIERAGYRHTMGKRRFREEFKALWDVPVDGFLLDRFVVSAFDDAPWNVPYMPGWKEQIADEGLAIVDGKFVCARAPSDPSLVYAITLHEHGEAHWVRQHKLGRGKRLKEIA